MATTKKATNQASRTAQTSVTNPVQVASSLGLGNNSWLKIGDGNWSGTVRLDGDAELVVEELASSWKVTDETGRTVTRRTLVLVLEAALKGF